jgi:hypothetical protein
MVWSGGFSQVVDLAKEAYLLSLSEEAVEALLVDG